MDASGIIVATAGWSIPRATSDSFPIGRSQLARYAQVFAGVEINSTFYRSHRAETWARWRDSVPPDFRFAVKLPRLISHEKRLVDVAGDFVAFVIQTSVLGNRRGPLLLQLPPSFLFDAAVVDTFLRMVRDQYDGAFVLEARHPSWFELDADQMIDSYGVTRVGADPPRAGNGIALGGNHGLTYLRLHGSPRVYFSSYDDVRLGELVELLAGRSGLRWCVFDNTASGAAAANALKLLKLIARRSGGNR